MAILLKCGQLIDGTGRPPVREAHIVVNGDRIAAVGGADEIQVPPDADVIDRSRATVLPGLIDCHTHLMLGFGDDPDECYPQPELYQMLKCGSCTDDMRVKNRDFSQLACRPELNPLSRSSIRFSRLV